MKVHFWGTRGSIPAAIGAANIRAKVKRALEMAVKAGVSDVARLDEFIENELPFSICGTYGTNTPCVEICVPGEEYVLCDSGSGLKSFGERIIATRGAGTAGVYHIFLSHPHWDHVQGFPFFSPAYIPGNKIHFYGCHKGLENVFKTQSSAPYFPVDFDTLGANIDFTELVPGEWSEIAGTRVLPFRQRHPGGSFGYRFEHDDKSVVYSTDCEHKLEDRESEKGFLEFCKNADILIFDAQYGFAESQTFKENWGHSNNIVGVELAKEAGVKHLCLFHHEPTLHDRKLEAYYEHTIKYERLYSKNKFLRISMTYDGLELEV